MLGYPAQIGYAGLAKELLDIKLSKSQTRTDWSRRPLTDAQLRYAAADVDHLLEMHDRMRKRLTELRRYSWAEEDAAELSDAAQYRVCPSVRVL